MGISALKRWIKQRFFRLNQDQRKKLSDYGDKLSTGALLPIALKVMSDGQPGDGWAIFLWLTCATVFMLLSVAALTKGDDDNDNG